MTEESNKPKEGVVIVVREHERFLMIQRAPDILAGGAWCFVGGGIEPGESESAAAEREFGEEVGGSVEPLEKIWEWRRSDGGLILHWWHCRRASESLTANPAEVAELGWFGLSQARDLPGLLASNAVFLDQLGARVVSTRPPG